MATCCAHGVHRDVSMYHRSARQRSSQQIIIGACTQRISLLTGQALENHWWLQKLLVAGTPAGAECMQAESLPCRKLAVLGHRCLASSLTTDDCPLWDVPA